MRDPHPFPVRHVRTCLLDPPLLPYMQAHLPFSTDLPLHVQVLENDHVRMVLLRESYNGCRCLFREFLIAAHSILPEAPHTLRAVPAALLPDPVQHLPQTVFFIREADELPRADSSVRLHDAAYRVRIEPKVHRADPLLLYRPVSEFPVLLIREPQEVLPVAFLQGRG